MPVSKGTPKRARGKWINQNRPSDAGSWSLWLVLPTPPTTEMKFPKPQWLSFVFFPSGSRREYRSGESHDGTGSDRPSNFVRPRYRPPARQPDLPAIRRCSHSWSTNLSGSEAMPATRALETQCREQILAKAICCLRLLVSQRSNRQLPSHQCPNQFAQAASLFQSQPLRFAGFSTRRTTNDKSPDGSLRRDTFRTDSRQSPPESSNPHPPFSLPLAMRLPSSRTGRANVLAQRVPHQMRR